MEQWYRLSRYFANLCRDSSDNILVLDAASNVLIISPFPISISEQSTQAMGRGLIMSTRVLHNRNRSWLMQCSADVLRDNSKRQTRSFHGDKEGRLRREDRPKVYVREEVARETSCELSLESRNTNDLTVIVTLSTENDLHGRFFRPSRDTVLRTRSYAYRSHGQDPC